MNLYFSRSRQRGSVLLLIGLIILLSACGQSSDNLSASDINSSEHSNHEHNGSLRINGDLRETTASLNELPSFLDGREELLVQSYQIAAKYADVLEYIPCYCGCGDSVGHRDNKMCFINEIREDGSVVWDDHGTRCNVCIETAVLSAKMDSEGATLMEIRQFIDEKYREGYAPPTKTIMPE